MMVPMACEIRHCRGASATGSVIRDVSLLSSRCHRGSGNGAGRRGVVGRYYDPQSGQFLSVDPLVEQTGQAYTYTGGDPVNGSDSDGMATCGGWLSWVPGCGVATDLQNAVSGHWHGIAQGALVIGGRWSPVAASLLRSEHAPFRWRKLAYLLGPVRTWALDYTGYQAAKQPLADILKQQGRAQSEAPSAQYVRQALLQCVPAQ
jgi:hypothetical protein